MIGPEPAWELSKSAPSPGWWLGVSFASLWAGLLAHEGAHFGTLAIVNWVGTRPPMGAPVVAAAGPLMTLAIVAVCAVIVSRTHRAVTGRIAFVAAAAAASRLVLIGIPTILGKNNDEHTVALATGWPAGLIWTVEAALTTVLLVWIVRRCAAHLLLSQIGLTLFGILAGWIFALTFGRAIGLPI